MVHGTRDGMELNEDDPTLPLSANRSNFNRIAYRSEIEISREVAANHLRKLKIDALMCA